MNLLIHRELDHDKEMNKLLKFHDKNVKALPGLSKYISKLNSL